jgi:hypothetical protein
MNGRFSIRAWNHQGFFVCRWIRFQGDLSRFRGLSILRSVHFQKNLFFASEEDIAIHQISRVNGPWVLILPHFWWGMMYLMLGIHHTLVWNRVLHHNQGWLLQVLLWGLLRSRWCWRTWCIHGFFHLFEVNNLGTIMSIMSIFTTKRKSEVRTEVFVVLPLVFFIIVPLGVLVSLIFVAPSGLVLLGVFSAYSWVIIVSVFSFLLGII